VIIGDDVFLNPKINEHNYKENFGLTEKHDFINSFIALDNLKNYWFGAKAAYQWDVNTNGLEIEQFFPDRNLVKEKINSYGLIADKIPLAAVYAVNPKYMKGFRHLLIFAEIVRPKLQAFASSLKGKNTLSRKIQMFLKKHFKARLDYPLVGGYSDIFVLSKHSFDDFIFYAGLFSASNLFVEIAIPTALIMASESIATEADLELKGRAFWGDEIEELSHFNYSLRKLVDDFPSSYLFVHPIKLSKWRNL